MTSFTFTSYLQVFIKLFNTSVKSTYIFANKTILLTPKSLLAFTKSSDNNQEQHIIKIIKNFKSKFLKKNSSPQLHLHFWFYARNVKFIQVPNEVVNNNIWTILHVKTLTIDFLDQFYACGKFFVYLIIFCISEIAYRK